MRILPDQAFGLPLEAPTHISGLFDILPSELPLWCTTVISGTPGSRTTLRARGFHCQGAGFGRNEYPRVITKSGIHAAPIPTLGLRHKPIGARISTGFVGSDDILDGGYRQTPRDLFDGVPGTGKTLSCSTFVAAACGHPRPLAKRCGHGTSGVGTRLRGGQP
ncbi:MAG: hypothetical protein FJ276_14650 [Planctomycetes bacterium]|nr:hypothetical protein [Planctomycetota bacterium]